MSVHQRGKCSFVFYGIEAETGRYIDPIAPRAPVDEVTGYPIPGGQVAFQDGMMKDRRVSAGSWENAWRDELQEGMGMITYDPALGVQQVPAGYKDD